MRSYDGVNYHHGHDDVNQEASLKIITNLIGYRPVSDELCYSLRFYAGGLGVDDRIAIRCLIDEASWPLVMQRMSLRHYRDAERDPAWREDFLWLLKAEEHPDSIGESCYRFINTNKLDFQDKADERCDIFFSSMSDVNSWCAVWCVDGRLNYLRFDQG